MKSLIQASILLIIIMSLILYFDRCGYAGGWTVNGVQVSKLSQPKNIGKFALGCISSCLIHTAGHYIMGNVFGVAMRQNPENITEEIWSHDPGVTKTMVINRAGFIAQLGVGYLLNRSNLDKSYRLGFNTFSLLEISTYQLIHGNELTHDLGDSINPWVETAGWTVLAVKNLQNN